MDSRQPKDEPVSQSVDEAIIEALKKETQPSQLLEKIIALIDMELDDRASKPDYALISKLLNLIKENNLEKAIQPLLLEPNKVGIVLFDPDKKEFSKSGSRGAQIIRVMMQANDLQAIELVFKFCPPLTQGLWDEAGNPLNRPFPSFPEIVWGRPPSLSLLGELKNLRVTFPPKYRFLHDLLNDKPHYTRSDIYTDMTIPISMRRGDAIDNAQFLLDSGCGLVNEISDPKPMKEYPLTPLDAIRKELGGPHVNRAPPANLVPPGNLYSLNEILSYYVPRAPVPLNDRLLQLGILLLERNGHFYHLSELEVANRLTQDFLFAEMRIPDDAPRNLHARVLHHELSIESIVLKGEDPRTDPKKSYYLPYFISLLEHLHLGNKKATAFTPLAYAAWFPEKKAEEKKSSSVPSPFLRRLNRVAETPTPTRTNAIGSYGGIYIGGTNPTVYKSMTDEFKNKAKQSWPLLSANLLNKGDQQAQLNFLTALREIQYLTLSTHPKAQLKLGDYALANAINSKSDFFKQKALEHYINSANMISKPNPFTGKIDLFETKSIIVKLIDQCRNSLTPFEAKMILYLVVDQFKKIYSQYPAFIFREIIDLLDPFLNNMDLDKRSILLSMISKNAEKLNKRDREEIVNNHLMGIIGDQIKIQQDRYFEEKEPVFDIDLESFVRIQIARFNFYHSEEKPTNPQFNKTQAQLSARLLLDLWVEGYSSILNQYRSAKSPDNTAAKNVLDFLEKEETLKEEFEMMKKEFEKQQAQVKKAEPEQLVPREKSVEKSGAVVVEGLDVDVPKVVSPVPAAAPAPTAAPVPAAAPIPTAPAPDVAAASIAPSAVLFPAVKEEQSLKDSLLKILEEKNSSLANLKHPALEKLTQLVNELKSDTEISQKTYSELTNIIQQLETVSAKTHAIDAKETFKSMRTELSKHEPKAIPSAKKTPEPHKVHEYKGPGSGWSGLGK